MPLVPSPTILPAANVDASFVGTYVGTSAITGGAGRMATTVVGSIGHSAAATARHGSTAG
jgi:hypothetical protein